MAKKIIFMQVRDLPVPLAVLEFCYKYTPLVEPLEDGSLFLDFTGCQLPFRKTIKDIAMKAYSETGNFTEVGVATSKLLARSLVTCQTTGETSGVWQYIKKGKFSVTIISLGKEKEFIASIPLQDFYVFKRQEIQKLNRLDLKTVGDLETVPFSALVSIMGKNAYRLLDKSKGIDNSPVLGLYPPIKITYRIPAGVMFTDFTVITGEIKKASKTLAAILAKKHSGCRCLELRAVTEKEFLQNQRKLTSHCYRSSEINNILNILLQDLALAQEIKELYIVLAEIAPLSWQQPDLFTPDGYDQNKKSRVADVLKEVNYKFPGKLLKGKRAERREQVLSFWDPWRY